jgi:protein gp37
MGITTKIAWTDHTFNPWSGCIEVSPACAHCYAREQAKRNPKLLGRWGDEKDATRVFRAETYWWQPLKWNESARRDGVRRRVFCASMADVFEVWDGPMHDIKGNTLYMQYWTNEGTVPIELQNFQPNMEGQVGWRPMTMSDARYRLFSLIDATPDLDWLILTKRPENIERLWPFGWYDDQFTWPNVWLGTTAENQRYADERIPKLLKIHQAAVRFVSYEPALAGVDFTRVQHGEINSLTGECEHQFPLTGRSESKLNWVIVGGESGSHARHFNLAWARSTIEQCRSAGVACFAKQLGAKPYDTADQSWETGERIHLKDSHGGNMEEWPEDLRVQEFPKRGIQS